MVGILRGDDGELAALGMAGDHARPRQVDVARQDQVQGRPRQRILFGRLAGLAVEHRHLAARGQNQRLIRRRIFEPHPAGAPDVEPAVRGGAVGIDLLERRLGAAQPVEIARDLGERDRRGPSRGGQREKEERGEEDEAFHAA